MQAIEHLAARIREIERRGAESAPDRVRIGTQDAAPHREGWLLGVADIDSRLGPGGLETGALHEIKPAMADGTTGQGSDWAGAFTAALGFALALSLRRLIGGNEACGSPPDKSRFPGTLLWCWPTSLAQEIGGLYAPGLSDLGLDPASLIVVEPDKAAEVLWAMEEGLKAPGLDLVIGVLGEAGLTPARRLALAAAAHDIPCLMITAPHTPVAGATATRWRVGRAVSARHPLAGRLDDALPGAPRYRVVLERSRASGLTGPTSPLILEWSDATHRFHLASPPADRTSAEKPSRHSRR